MRLGYACAWESTRQGTWSGTPLALRNALAAQADVDLVDIEPDPARRWRALLRLANVRRTADGQLVSAWRWSRAWQRITQRDVASAVTRHRVDALLQIGDLAVTRVPTWTYQDLSYSSLLPYFAPGQRGTGPLQAGLTRAVLERKIRAQERFYDQATGVFAMSEWLRRDLLSGSGAVREVTVVPPGRNTRPPARSPSDDERRATRPRRLLAIGVDFHRKGIDLAVDAAGRLRKAGREVELTVAGPDAWPRGQPVPPGVRFLGRVPAGEVPQLYAAHDVFVLPSRFEPFGIVFTEALVAGLPVVGRDAFAMPEFITHGENGQLVSAECEDSEELAQCIAVILDAPRMFANVARSRDDVAARYSWDRAARLMRDVMSGSTM